MLNVDGLNCFLDILSSNSSLNAWIRLIKVKMERKIELNPESEEPKAKPKPKTPPTKRKSRAAKLSKEQLLIALQRKKECNAQAQRIVELFLDPVPPEKVDFFLSKLMHINQAHYDDIVEERSITMLCGYPMCDKALSNIPKQQYIISRIHNKVYDITERKKFCSNECYKSSVYIREQILTTPLWVRKEDDIIPEFKLLSVDDGDETKSNQKLEDKNEDTGKVKTENEKGKDESDKSCSEESSSK